MGDEEAVPRKARKRSAWVLMEDIVVMGDEVRD